MTVNKAKIILVDDHAVVRAGFKMLLAVNEQIEVIAEASRGEQAIKLFKELKPDVLVLDLSMPGMGGLETIRRIVQYDASAAILVFSVHHEQVYVDRAINAGAKGYITKNSAANILNDALLSILQGNCYVESGLIKITKQDREIPNYRTTIDAFSEREFDVFRMLAEGMTVSKIADQLCLGYKTIANYATTIKKKLAVDSLVELAHIAEELQIIQRSDRC